MKDQLDHEANRRQAVKDKRDDLLFGIEEQLICSFERCTCLGRVEIASGDSISRLTEALMSKIKEL